MVINDIISYNNFKEQCSNDTNIIIDFIALSQYRHPINDKLSAVLIYSIDTSISYFIPINHYDIDFSIDIDDFKNYLNNINANKWIFNKKAFIHFIKNINNLYDINLLLSTNSKEIVYSEDFRTECYNRISRKYDRSSYVNTLIPSGEHIKMFINKCECVKNDVLIFNKNESFYKINELVIDNLNILESNGLHVDIDTFNKYFSDKHAEVIDGFVYTEYNIYTSTGRPSNKFQSINYSALKKDDGSRNSFTTRFGENGSLFLIDYSAYHPHIVSKLINYNLPDNAYDYLGKFYFNKDTLSKEELSEAKVMTFRSMYGLLTDDILEIPFFSKMKEYIDNRWIFFNKHGYIETPIFKRKITAETIRNPNPNKLFNYILQASELEFMMESLTDVNRYLKNKESKAILYTYDSILFDVSNKDGLGIYDELLKIMRGYTNKFPVKSYKGNSYGTLENI